MTTLLIAWVVFPLTLGALSLGCGLAVQAAADRPIPGILLLPTGFALVLVTSQLATMSSHTAQLATPTVVAVAAAGLLLPAPLRRPRPSRWPLLAAGGAFAVFAAPVLGTGSATFTGWIKLDDTATWLAFTDHLMRHGRDLAGLVPSTHQTTLAVNLTGGYPVGSLVPFGVGGQLVQIDLAWLFAPYLAFVAAMVALAVYSLSDRIVRSPGLRALSAFVAAQAATLLGFALWGGVKELVAAALIALVAALVPLLLEPAARPRAAIPLGIAAAATLGALSAGGAVWLAPILVPALWLVWRAHGVRFAAAGAAWFVGAMLLAAIPSLALARQFQLSATGVVTSETELGNLIRPLKLVQALGIWPAGDFRLDPQDGVQTYLLLAIAAVAAAAGIVLAVRSRRPAFVLYVASGLAGALLLELIASPWIAGKALATASPALVAAAMVGGSALFESRFRIGGAVAILAVAGGVLWSNVLQIHDVSLAPRAELAELAAIGSRFAGQGPALMTEYSPYGARHFLRQLDAESASELRWRLIPLRTGRGLDKGGSADIDEFQTDAVLVYRTLVLRHSPTTSRPPSAYSRVWQGKHYEVWQRPAAGGGRILEHLPLGTPLDPGGVPGCSDVERLAGVAGAGGRLATVRRVPTQTLDLAAAGLPGGWIAHSGVPGTVTPSGRGTLRTAADIAAPGRYGFWLGGAFRGRLDVVVDGRQVFSGRGSWAWPGAWMPVGEALLRRGGHTIELRYHGAGLSPGSGGPQYAMGPLVLGRELAPNRVEHVDPAAWASLCGKRLDWVEAVRP